MEGRGTKLRNIRLVYFGHNRKDVALIRRINSFQEIGIKITSYTFRRDGEPSKPAPPWENVDLGYVEHAQLLARVKVLLLALVRLIQHKRGLRNADIIYARNLDMAILAWISMAIMRLTSAQFVYECLDVHESLTKQGLLAKILRWLERIILKRAKLLVVSSPGFIQYYFKPYQNYDGAYYLLENKIHFHKNIIKRPNINSVASHADKPIILVWAGILRCQKTLDVLKQLAYSAQENIYVRLHGVISEFLIPDFKNQIKDIINIEYMGPYIWPDGLQEVYKDADMVWAQELSWRGYNSDWLIPNRVYEASYFGVPSIGIAGTQTSRMIKERALGYVFDERDLRNLAVLITSISKNELENKKKELLSRPNQEFVSNKNDAESLINAII